MRRAVQSCGSTGCVEVQQPEYVLAAPVVRQGATGQPVPGAPVTLRLAGASVEGAQVTLALDPTWLRASGRAFPLRVDLRLESALSAVRNTTEESVSRCAGAAPAVGGDLVVGTEGGCTYRAFLRFDIGATILRSPIQAASLHLYAPGQAGPAGVQVYAGAPPAKLSLPTPASIPPVLVPTPPISAPVAAADPVDFREPPRPAYQPYADAAVAAAPGAQGIAAQSSGPWQSWDVTGIAQAWSTQGSAANGGLVLAGQGAPVVFAGSRGAAEADPALAPYLDVTFAPLPAAAPASAAGRAVAPASARPRQIDNPSQTTTVGLAQGYFQPDGTCYRGYGAQLGNPGCMSPGATTILEFGYANTVNLSYVRGNSIHFPCNAASFYAPATWQSVYTYMQNAYNDNLIPIVTFVQDAGCQFSASNPNTDWQSAMQWFAFLMPQMSSPKFGSNPPMYFEVGNEPDVTNDQYGNPIPGAVANWASFPQWFGEGAGGLNADLGTIIAGGVYNINGKYVYVPGHATYTNFHILTAGMAAPQVNTTNCAGAAPQQITNLQQAITTAGSYYVPSSRLGVAAHPYSYDVSLNGIPPNIAAQYPYLFPNYYSLGKRYLGPCGDIDQLIVNWDGYFPNLVQFTTEDNYDSRPLDPAQAATNLSAAYLMDLRTWLWYNLGADGQWGYKNNGVWGERGYPFNLIWFNGIDDAGAGGVPGLLGKTSQQAPSQALAKIISFQPNCPGAPQVNYYGASLTIIMANISRAGGGAYSGQIAGEHC